MESFMDSGELRALRVFAERAPQFTLSGLPLTALEHGAYYAGKIGVTSVVARWHAKKQRFVFEEFALGRQHVRSVPHGLDGASPERFVPMARIEPKGTQCLSDYAFETSA